MGTLQGSLLALPRPTLVINQSLVGRQRSDRLIGQVGVAAQPGGPC